MNSPNLHLLAQACWQGACNPHGIIRSLAETIGEIPPGRRRESVDLKIILGQLSFLLGENYGPTARNGSLALEGFSKVLVNVSFRRNAFSIWPAFNFVATLSRRRSASASPCRAASESQKNASISSCGSPLPSA